MVELSPSQTNKPSAKMDIAEPASDYGDILSPAATAFLAELHRRFDTRIHELLAARKVRQAKIDEGEFPNFILQTETIRKGNWKVAPIPKDLLQRRVEITGPVDRKMMINALNSGADVFMADFEDAHSPRWQGTLDGHRNVCDAVKGVIEFTSEQGKHYKLNSQVATLILRPRGWHLCEKHFRVDGQAISGALFDFGLSFFNTAKPKLENGSGPYYYLPKLESHLEARLWNEVFVFAQDYFGVPQATIKVTVLIETILAAFEMDEILYELKNHIVGLNCGRWDYIFSYIKKLRNHANFTLPDRAQVTMTSHFLRSYSLLLIKTCHKRGAFAMGGMAAQIPVKNNQAANDLAFKKVREDKEREASDGHDGTWVAHPALVPVAMQVFQEHMPGQNQLERLREDVVVVADDLLKVAEGDITEAGLRNNINVGIQYIEAWLNGSGAVPIHNLMEDAATAEISRAQIWQWLKHGGRLSDGTQITKTMVSKFLDQELDAIKEEVGEQRVSTGKYKLAAELFSQVATNEDFEDFLTLAAYDRLN